jgi:hypothetical protein
MYRLYAPIAPWAARVCATLRQDQVVHQDQPAPLDVCYAVLPRPAPSEHFHIALVTRPAADEWATFLNAHGAAGPDYRVSMSTDYMAKLLLPRNNVTDKAVYAMEVRCNGLLVGTLLDRGIHIRCATGQTLNIGLMDTLCVAGPYRGRGVARCMLAWMGHYAAKRGRRVHLNSHDKTAMDWSIVAKCPYWYRTVDSTPVPLQAQWSVTAVEWAEVVQARLMSQPATLVELSVPQSCESLFRVAKGDTCVYLRRLPMTDLVHNYPMWEIVCATGPDIDAACEACIQDGLTVLTVLYTGKQGPSAKWHCAASQYWHLYNAAWPLEWYQGGIAVIEQGI